MAKLYVVKSSTFKGVWGYYDGRRKNVYAERYLGLGNLHVIQMNGMNYDRNKLLVFKTQQAAENACRCANATLRKLTVVGEHGEITLNDYKVIEYKPTKPITALAPVPLFGATGYVICE